MATLFIKTTVAALGLVLIAHHAVSAALTEGTLIQPTKVHLDKSLSDAQNEIQSLAARRYYTFWGTGDARFAKAALDESFKDLNLPQGRPQGPEGALQASAHFRQAIPDLQVEVEEMLIVGDKVIGRLHFRGHFTGKFNGTQGAGQSIDFSAIDIYRIAQGKIVENWHLEDNLELLLQMGLVNMK